MGLFPLIPKRARLNIPHLRSYIPRLEITQTQIISNHPTNSMKNRLPNNQKDFFVLENLFHAECLPTG
jgi:hypothetical protein